MKKKQQFAQRGHKLLKDKLEGLLKDFTGIVQDYAVLRDQVDSELGELFQQFIVASASMPAEVYRSALAFPECEAELTMTEKLIMNVRVPVFRSPSRATCSPTAPTAPWWSWIRRSSSSRRCWSAW